MAEQILFTEKVRNPKKLDQWIPLRRVLGDANGAVTAIQFFYRYGNPIDEIPAEIVRNTSPKMLEHAGVMNIVDGVEIDKYGKLTKIIISAYQLPYPSAVTSTEEPVADDTVIWINPDVTASTKKTIRRDGEEPTEIGVRLWVIDPDEGGLSGSVALSKNLPKTSSVLVWTQDEATDQERIGYVYTGLEDPQKNDFWWVKAEQIDPEPEEEPEVELTWNQKRQALSNEYITRVHQVYDDTYGDEDAFTASMNELNAWWDDSLDNLGPDPDRPSGGLSPQSVDDKYELRQAYYECQDAREAATDAAEIEM